MSRFRVALIIVILMPGTAMVRADTYTINLSTGVIPGAESAGAYGIPAFAEFGFDWWPALTGGYGAFTASLMTAHFVPEGEAFGRSFLLAPLAGIRGAYPLGESGFLLGAELVAGLYARWSRYEGDERNARRPLTRGTIDFLFRDAYGWESGVRAGWIGWLDQQPVHTATIGVVVGRRW